MRCEKLFQLQEMLDTYIIVEGGHQSYICNLTILNGYPWQLFVRLFSSFFHANH